jgi:hypothetical protein
MSDIHELDPEILGIFEGLKNPLSKEIREAEELLEQATHKHPYIVHGGTVQGQNSVWCHSMVADNLPGAFIELMSSEATFISSLKQIIVLRPNEPIPDTEICLTMESTRSTLPDQNSRPTALFQALEKIYKKCTDDFGTEAFIYLINPIAEKTQARD